MHRGRVLQYLNLILHCGVIGMMKVTEFKAILNIIWENCVVFAQHKGLQYVL